MKNIETIMKFCSKLNEVFGYPYFFNWSAPTNHRDNTPDGEITDVNYVLFRVGTYQPPKTEMIDGVEYETSRKPPIEKLLFFGSIYRIIDFTPFILLMFKGDDTPCYDDYPIKNFDDLENNKEELKVLLDNFLNKK